MRLTYMSYSAPDVTDICNSQNKSFFKKRAKHAQDILIEQSAAKLQNMSSVQHLAQEVSLLTYSLS